jgi:hypothetical protein
LPKEILDRRLFSQIQLALGGKQQMIGSNRPQLPDHGPPDHAGMTGNKDPLCC